MALRVLRHGQLGSALLRRLGREGPALSLGAGAPPGLASPAQLAGCAARPLGSPSPHSAWRRLASSDSEGGEGKKPEPLEAELDPSRARQAGVPAPNGLADQASDAPLPSSSQRGAHQDSAPQAPPGHSEAVLAETGLPAAQGGAVPLHAEAGPSSGSRDGEGHPRAAGSGASEAGAAGEARSIITLGPRLENLRSVRGPLPRPRIALRLLRCCVLEAPSLHKRCFSATVSSEGTFAQSFPFACWWLPSPRWH